MSKYFVVSLILLFFHPHNHPHVVHAQIEEDQAKFATQSSPIVIHKETFNNVINEPLAGTFVMYYAPWCGHCKRMQSTWNRLAETHNPMKNVLVAKVDCTVDTELCSDHDILAYPTFVYYKKGNPNGERYEGERTQQTMESYMLTMSFIDDEKEHQAHLVEPPANGKYVHTPTGDEFKQFISSGFHFVKFYADWCGHCKILAPTWEDLGQAYANTDVKISKIECSVYQSLCQEYGIRGYPTLIFFHNGKKIEAYNSDRDVASFSRFIDGHVQQLGGSKPEGSRQEEYLYQYKDESATYHEVDGQVIELTTQNMDKALKKPGLLFVKFMAPWCGHCKAMAPTWIELAKHYQGNPNVRIGEVDCTNNNELCMNNNVNAYPTLILFKNGQQFKEYTQSRSIGNLINFIESGARDEL